MAARLDHEEQIELVEHFVSKVPPLLRGQPFTAELADKIETLAQSSNSPFTLAVVGQMRSGKSTLLNALIGKDLAVTGVNETTATINWLKHGEGEQLERFRVHWRDASPEDFPLSAIDQWQGTSEKAEATAFLEFFHDAPFLRTSYIVDTPGSRSVIDTHESTLRQFLAEKLEAESRCHGGAAHAVLYVFPPVARENDQDLLEAFEQTTRMPGSSPFNAIGVLHMWETLDVEDALTEAQNKARRVAAQLKDHVSEVLPVSAPLAIAAGRLPNQWWQDAAAFTSRLSAKTLQSITDRGEMIFETRVFADCRYPPAERSGLYKRSGLPWPCFRFLVRHAQRKGCTGGTEMQQLAAEVSGLAVLRRRLNEQFFSRAKLVKYMTLLARVLEPCRTAQLRIIQRIQELQESERLGQAAVVALESRPSKHLEPALRFICEILAQHQSLPQALGEMERNLTAHMRAVAETFEQLDADMRCLRLLDQVPTRLTELEREEVRCVLGSRGSKVAERCAAYRPNGHGLYDHLMARIDFWTARAERSFGSEKAVAEQMTARLAVLADLMQSLSHEESRY